MYLESHVIGMPIIKCYNKSNTLILEVEQEMFQARDILNEHVHHWYVGYSLSPNNILCTLTIMSTTDQDQSAETVLF